MESRRAVNGEWHQNRDFVPRPAVGRDTRRHNRTIPALVFPSTTSRWMDKPIPYSSASRRIKPSKCGRAVLRAARLRRGLARALAGNNLPDPFTSESLLPSDCSARHAAGV
jgi:hypothetical protein